MTQADSDQPIPGCRRNEMSLVFEGREMRPCTKATPLHVRPCWAAGLGPPCSKIEFVAPARFDADLSPSAEINRRAARDRGWRFNALLNRYVDADGALVADRFGQPL